MALELLRRAVNDSAAFTLVNLARAGEAGGGRAVSNGGPSYEAVRKGIEAGGVGEATAGAIPVVIVGTRNAPVPVNVVGGRAEHEQDQLIKSWLDEQRELNKGPGKPGAGPPPKKDAVGETLMMRFAGVLAPLAMLHTVLSQTTSGMGTFRKSLDLVGTAISPIILPIFVILASAFTVLSETILGKLLPALDGWYEWFKNHGLPAAEKQIEHAADNIDLFTAAKNFVTGGEVPKFGDIGRLGDTFLRNIDPGIGTGQFIDRVGGLGDLQKWSVRQGNAAEDFVRGQLGMGPRKNFFGTEETPAAPGGGKPEGESPLRAKFDAAMRDVMKSLQLSMGPKASYAGLTEVGKNAQLAALNQDPLEARMLRMQQQIFELLVRHFGQPDKPDTGTATFQRK